MLLVMLLFAMFASVYTIAKLSLQYAAPLFIVGARMFLAGIILVGFQSFFQRKEIELKPKHYGKILQLGLFNIYLTNILSFIALQNLDSFKSCFTYSLSPFITAFFAYFLLSEHISRKKLIGLTIGFIGFIPILFDNAVDEASLIPISFTWAQGIMFLAVVSNVYGWILLQELVRDAGYSPIMMNGLSMIVGGAIALVHSYLTENWVPLPISDYMAFFYTFCFLIVVSNFICYPLYGVLLKRFSATFMSFAGFTTPLFTALFGWLFLGEIVTWHFFLSVMIVFCGVVIFSQEELSQDDKKPIAE